MIPPALLARLGSLELIARTVVDGRAARRPLHRPARVQPGIRRIPGLRARRRSTIRGLETPTPRTDRTLVEAVRRRDQYPSAGIGGRQRIHEFVRSSERTVHHRASDQASLCQLPGGGAGIHRRPPTRCRRIDGLRRRSADVSFPRGRDARTCRRSSIASTNCPRAAGSDWSEAFTHAASRMTKRGVIAAISDFYCDPEAFGRALRMLGGARSRSNRFSSARCPGTAPASSRSVRRQCPRCAT